MSTVVTVGTEWLALLVLVYGLPLVFLGCLLFRALGEVAREVRRLTEAVRVNRGCEPDPDWDLPAEQWR